MAAVLPDPVTQSSGSAAYGALTRLAEVRPDETVFVTGAAGGVGTPTGPVARLPGATRVIGSTRSPAKAERGRHQAVPHGRARQPALRRGHR